MRETMAVVEVPTSQIRFWHDRRVWARGKDKFGRITWAYYRDTMGTVHAGIAHCHEIIRVKGDGYLQIGPDIMTDHIIPLNIAPLKHVTCYNYVRGDAFARATGRRVATANLLAGEGAYLTIPTDGEGNISEIIRLHDLREIGLRLHTIGAVKPGMPSPDIETFDELASVMHDMFNAIAGLNLELSLGMFEEDQF